MTITLTTTNLLLLLGSLPVLWVFCWTLIGALGWLRSGGVYTVTLRIGGPFNLLIAALLGALLYGIFRVIS